MKRNRAFVKKLEGKLIDLFELDELVKLHNNAYTGYFSTVYNHSPEIYEAIMLPNPWILVLESKKSSIKFLAADSRIYWCHLTNKRI